MRTFRTMCIGRATAAFLALAGFLVLSCGNAQLPGREDTTKVVILAQPLSDEVDVAFMAMGRSSSFLPFGGRGVLMPASGGAVRFATIEFDDVPEGDAYRVDYVGYHVLPTFPARPTAASPWRCTYDHDTNILSVVSGVRNAVTLEAIAYTNRCTFLAGDRYVVNPNYVADPHDARYGSLDRENLLVLFVHGIAAGASITVKACDTLDPSCTAPFGIFTTLPDGVFTPWPGHLGSAWPKELTVTADGVGNALVYLVVKPGEAPRLWDIEVVYPSGTTPPSELYRVRLSNGNRIELQAQ